MYAVPSLILCPGKSIPVSDANQTEAFFATSWSQYEGVDAVDKQIVVMGESPGSVWADVTWSYDGKTARAVLLPARGGQRRLPDCRAHALE